MKNIRVLTVIEVIVVIVFILVALFIWYGSFTSGSKESRDAQRIAHVLSLWDTLKLYYSVNKNYPIPDKYVHLTASGKTLTVQWYLSPVLSQSFWIEHISDPLWDKNFTHLNDYTYAVDDEKQSFQVMAYLEWEKQVSYTPLQVRVPYSYGDAVGIALEEKNLRPIQEAKRSVDVLHTKERYKIYLWEKSVLTGNHEQLKSILSLWEMSTSTSCKEIRDAGIIENGYYYIQPFSSTGSLEISKPFAVYCDMESDGWGWTRLYYKNGKETCFNDENMFTSWAIEKLFTKDFAVSDTLETLQSEGSWILRGVDFKNEHFSFEKFANVANCMTPTGTNWSMEYGSQFQFYHEENGKIVFNLDDNSWLLWITGKLTTLGSWNKMFYGCNNYKNIWEKTYFKIWGFQNHTAWFIHSDCNNYSSKDNSITSRWDWDNTRVMWVR